MYRQIAVIIMIFAAILVSTFFQVAIAQQQERSKLTFPYENKESGIKLEYPYDWTKYEYSQSQQTQAESENSTANGKVIPIIDFCPSDEAKSTRPISPCVDPKVENVERLSMVLHLLNKSNASLDNFAKKMTDEHKSSLRSVNIVAYNKTTLAGLPAYKIQYTVNWGTATSTKESNIIQKRIEFLVIKDGIGYDITYFADFSSPSNVQYPSSPAPIDVRNIISSMQINKPDLSTFSQLNATPSQVISSAVDSIIMTINLQPHENEFLAKDGYYQINTLDMNATKGGKLCPSGDCQYSIENREFRQNKFSGGYVFDGQLKVSVVTNDTTNSKFYPVRADLDKTASQEKEGQTTEIIQGSIKFGKNTFSPDFEYKVDNGTLLVDPSAPVLILQGVKAK